MSTIFLGIDGTGVANDSQYAREFRHSFVRYVYLHTPAPNKVYHRGPAATLADLQSGSDTPFLVSEGFTFVNLAYSEGDRVLLAGYSRGAAAVVGVAQHLAIRQIPVAGLMLFDCVDRCPEVDTMTIPANVAEVIHAQRHMESQSRESFANSGLRGSPPTIYNGRPIRSAGASGHGRFFFGTHGALGGVPWRATDENNPHPPVYIDEGFPDGLTRITFERDLQCAREVWGAVHPDLERLGFL